ncbi:MAG: alpha/beta hydrolase [Rhizomicrobium sp.]
MPLHLYCHGGGFVIGSALSGEMDGPLSRRAAAADCVVASVEYALAPEHPFPAGIEDCYRALTGLAVRAEELGLAAQAISVGGASSGGNFAAVLALMAKDRGGPKLILQLLEIAGVDLTKTSHAWRYPLPQHDTTRERDLAMLDLYIAKKDRAARYGSPLFVPDLEGLPQAYVMNAALDPRRDECEAYVARSERCRGGRGGAHHGGPYPRLLPADGLGAGGALAGGSRRRAARGQPRGAGGRGHRAAEALKVTRSRRLSAGVQRSTGAGCRPS